MIEGEPIGTMVHETYMDDCHLLFVEFEGGEVGTYLASGLDENKGPTDTTIGYPFPAFDAMSQLCEILGTSLQVWEEAQVRAERLGYREDVWNDAP